MKVETLSRLCTGQTMITWQNCFFRRQVNVKKKHWWKR